MDLFRRAATPPPRARVIRRSIVASASSAAGNKGKAKRLHQDWQSRALEMYNEVEVCWYPAQFYARSLSSIRFFPAILDNKGDVKEVETGPLVDLFERIQDPGGGRSDLTGSYGRLQFLIGDGYLVVSPDEESEEEAWEYLSPLELRKQPDSARGRTEYVRLRAPGLTPEELVEAPDDAFEPMGNEARVWRLHRRHPTYSQWADSPVRAVLDLYELLRTLTASAAAESISRLDRGVFYLPTEIDLEDPNAEEGGSEDPSLTIFAQEWQEAVTAAIKNPSDASAMSPIFLTGPGTVQGPNGTAIPVKDLLGYVQIGRQNDYKEAELWDKTILRISYGLDMPKERVTGVGELNHWTGWLVDEEGFRQHIAPVAENFCSDVAAAYLRPAAIEAGVDDADRVVIGYDPAGAINHPDEIKTAKEAFELGTVSSAFYRDKMGALEKDAATEEDRAWILALKGKSLPDEEDEQEGETNPAEGGRGGDTEEEPPEVEDSQRNGNGRNAQVAAARIGAAIELTIERARELAGSRLRRRSQGCEECKQAIDGVPATLVASALGAEQVRDIIDGSTTEASLVAGTGERFAATIIRWGVPVPTAEFLGTLVEQHALRTLYEPDAPLPEELDRAVQKALAA